MPTVTSTVSKVSNRFDEIHDVFQTYKTGDINSVNAVLYEWVVPFYCRILDIQFDSGLLDPENTPCIIDVNVDGTSIFTNQDNRPTHQPNTLGKWTVGMPDIEKLVPGQVLSIQLDQVSTGGSFLGPSRTKFNILVGVR